MAPNKDKNAVYAIVPAAGSGQRMGAELPKQYLKIAGKTVLEHAVNVLAGFPLIKKVVLALGAEDFYWQKLAFLEASKILTVLGGSTRAESVLNALQIISEFAKPEDWVLVHDAARPCLRTSDIAKLIDIVGDHAVGGILGIPVSDTLKRVNPSSEIIKTEVRDNMWCAQTPQLFRFEILWKALNEAKIPYTDDSGAVENLGLKPLMVLGGVHNIKITYPDDLLLAENYLKKEMV